MKTDGREGLMAFKVEIFEAKRKYLVEAMKFRENMLKEGSESRKKSRLASSEGLSSASISSTTESLI